MRDFFYTKIMRKKTLNEVFENSKKIFKEGREIDAAKLLLNASKEIADKKIKADLFRVISIYLQNKDKVDSIKFAKESVNLDTQSLSAKINLVNIFHLGRLANYSSNASDSNIGSRM